MQRRRIKRDFRQMNSPKQFLAFCRRVLHALNDLSNLPESVLVLVKQLVEMVARFEELYHQALDCARSIIRERDNLMQEIIVLLDQLAAALESVFMLNPEALLATGFTVTQERRNPIRVKLTMISPLNFTVVNTADPGKALASAGSFPGVLVNEIHINTKDPSVEGDWFHKAIFVESEEMVLEDLMAGNTFVRMRHYGQDGAGPWSAVLSVTIT